jgi:selenocysteine lyase/cysteine desulfurase
MSWKAHFSRALSAAPGRVHLAAHSHHLWPDVSLAAHEQAWHDAARLADQKWEHVFGHVWPLAQGHVADELGVEPSRVVFAPNTHELVLRLLSCLPARARVVTSDGEFHSFERQARRLEEAGELEVERVPAEPFATFPERLLAAARAKPTQLVFVSHVLFNSGAVVPGLEVLAREVPADAMLVIDGYHGFCAVPTALGAAAERLFYLAGGYKYAMSGEGVCFLVAPPWADTLRPRNTGWFAAFGALEDGVGVSVPYGPGAMRFAGATFDPTGLYRFNAVMAWRREVGLTTAAARAHAHGLHARFVAALPRGRLKGEQLVVPVAEPLRGQFLTFRTPEARALSAALLARGVVTDARGDRLRFGFGPYLDEADVDVALSRLT